MWRALREKKSADLAVKALDCLDLCEVSTSTLLNYGSTCTSWAIDFFYYTCIPCSCEVSIVNN
jgi:hypothetical protein